MPDSTLHHIFQTSTVIHCNGFASALALALASRTTAQVPLESSDIAPNCASVCTNIVTASDNCERHVVNVDNSDQEEQDCLCDAPGMATAIPECEACQRQYYSQDDDYDEIQSILSACGLSSMSATGSMTMTSMGSAPTGGAGGATTIVTSTYTETDDDGDDDDDDDLETTTFTSFLPTDASTTATGTSATGGAGSVASSAAGSAGSAGISNTDAAGSPASSAADAASNVAGAAASYAAEQSGNFAPAIAPMPVLAMAGVAAAVFGL